MTVLNKFIMGCYKGWIEQNVPLYETAGNCTIWVRAMAAAFPELMPVGGYVQGINSMGWFTWPQYHEYLITEEGEIVDPTRVQYDKLFDGGWEYLRCNEHLLYLPDGRSN